MRPGSGRAFVIERSGTFPECVERMIPTAARGETLIRLGASQVSHLDLEVVTGDFPAAAPPPLVPGTEGAGRVLESDVFARGTRVRVRGGGVGLGRDGTWAEYVVAPNAAIHAVPEGVPDWLAACFFSPACTGWAAVHDVALVRAGDRVLVTGASGAVGRLAVQFAAEAGAHVTGLVSRTSKLEHVPAVATAVLLDDAPDLGAEFDVLIDTVGGNPFQLAIGKVRPGGRAAVLGYSAGRFIDVDLQRFVFSNVSLLPVNLLQRGPGLLAVADQLMMRLASGDLSLPVQSTTPQGLKAATKKLSTGELVGKLALVWDQP